MTAAEAALIAKNFSSGYLDTRSVMEAPSTAANIGAITRSIVDTGAEVLGYGLIAFDVANTFTGIGAGPDTGILGTALLGMTRNGAKNTSNFVYRTGSGTPTNLTPRLKDTGGLSANVNPMPGKNQVIDTSKLDKLCAVCDNPKTGHVSIKPKDTSQMQGWIDSRGSGTTHPLTQELMDAVVDQVKR